MMRSVAATLTVCFGIAGPAAGQTQQTWRFGFDGAGEGSLPDAFQTGMTGSGATTEWSVRSIEGNEVLAHFGRWHEDPEGVFPVCWVKGPTAEDLTLAVRLFPVPPPEDIPGAHHDGAGIVVRFADSNNYYLLRSVPHESRVRLYKVVSGKRSTLAGVDLGVAVGTWHELKVRVSGSLFTAYFDGSELFSFSDQTISGRGAFGLWSKPNNVTYFDDLVVEIFR